MVDPPKESVGKILPPIRQALSTVDGLAALNNVVEAARECIQLHEKATIEKSKFDAYKTVEVARIRAAETVLKNYFDQVFAERRYIYSEMFDRLDRAVEDGNGPAIHDVVRGIVDVARSSPLADLGDLSKIRAALDDPDQVWEL